ncbi:MAG: DUF4124 domain-containing protein [Gammaproteobacteria bacterium]
MMKKLFFQLSFLLVVMLAVIGYREWDTLSETAREATREATQAVEQARDSVQQHTASAHQAETGRGGIFKWQGADGQWNYGEEPPPDARNVTRMDSGEQVNVIQPQGDNTANLSASENASGETTTSKSEINLLPDPTMVKKLIEQAKEVQGLMDARTEALEHMAGGRPEGEPSARGGESQSNRGGLSLRQAQ